MGQTREPVLVETLVAEPAVERFDIGVLMRLARLDQAFCASLNRFFTSDLPSREIEL